MEKREPVYLCPNCYTAGDAPGPCSSCGHQVVECRPGDADDGADRKLRPDAIASAYLAVHRQHRSAWTWEMELRPWVENF